jgi:hypothetical protein
MPRYIFHQCLTLLLTLSFYRQGMIGKLSDEVLLSIFRYYLDAVPRCWPRLVHICHRWRRVVFASQQELHLRLFCIPGTPVSKTLDCWPALPIAMEYGGSLALNYSAPEDDVNIFAALKQSDRVSSISLTVTTSLLSKFYEIERPFLKLEDLILLSRGSAPLTLPTVFLWGPRLRRLHLTRVTFPALLQLLCSCRNLVDLQLHEALNPRCFSIEVLTDALSRMGQLRSLSLHFPSAANYVSPPQLPNRRIALPALTHLKFRGNSEDLERLVVKIDAPRLGDIQVTDSDKFILDLPKLRQFIDRIEMHKSLHQARVLSSEDAISISLTQPGAPTCLKLQVFSELLSEQLSAMSRITLHFPAFLLNVEDLHISSTRPSSREDSPYSGRWPVLINSFTGVKCLHLYGKDSTNIVRDFQGVNWRHKTVLPALHKLYLPHPGPRHAPLRGAIVSFMTSRWRSGYPIVGVEYERICRISELHETGTSLCTVPLYYVLTYLKRDLFQSQSRLITRCCAMTFFSTSFDNIWMPLRDFGPFSNMYAEGGNRSS